MFAIASARRRILLLTFTLLGTLGATCPKIEHWAVPHSAGTRLMSQRPECPVVWDTMPIFPRHRDTLKTQVSEQVPSTVIAPTTPGSAPQSPMSLIGPISNIPEFHDCQKFIVVKDGTPQYDSLHAIFAAFKLDSISAALGLEVTWTSSDASVANVTSSGLVTGVSAGTAVIKAVSISDPSISAAVALTVSGFSTGSAGTVKVPPGTNAAMQVGQTLQVEAALGPSNPPTFPVAEIYSYGPGYEALGIGPNFNCLYLYTAANPRSGAKTLRAKMVHRPGLGAEPDACFTEVRPDTLNGKDLEVIRTTGGSTRDFPAVARWDWDPHNHQQYIGIKCGAGWCEIGPPGFTRSPRYTVNPEAPEATVLTVKGWHDEQFLAVKDAGTGKLRPSRIRGTIIPHPRLASWTADQYRNSGWVPVGFVALTAATSDPDLQLYQQKLNLSRTEIDAPAPKLNRLFLCYGSRKHCGIPTSFVSPPNCKPDHIFIFFKTKFWWSKIEPPAGPPAYRCVTRRDHNDASAKYGIEMPGTTRWRWILADETGWELCIGGCCEIDTEL